ncbi:hypothetical protein [Hydrogenophaga sp.]|uniref:hypothetical protein n=1 Tax=Hydrogenophaga sp. TaxID=1904254 RepID=UPI0026355ABE|nr:hypothetical protein [Hydrogenophaga sp.]MDM7948099.1 hypothetical protein [Hydrogenophaga sp.]
MRPLASSTLPRHLLLSACGVMALLVTLRAHALGRLADVQLIDRDSGEVLPVYRHQGEHWVAGRSGARYAVALRNTSSGRTLNVVSVDGVNVISGETAALHQTGYVLGAWQSYQVTGWRKSDSEIAAFHFTASPASYAERTGRPANLGVIGVALFREKVVPPPVLMPAPRPYSPSQNRERLGAAAGEASAESAAPMAEQRASADGASAESLADSPVASRRMAPAAPAPRLGTGHGAREGDRVGHTNFERRSSRPDEIIRIRYDSFDNLVAMGVIPQRAVPPRPNPFPEPAVSRYAPDPS